jgi:hypothetical protein
LIAAVMAPRKSGCMVGDSSVGSRVRFTTECKFPISGVSRLTINCPCGPLPNKLFRKKARYQSAYPRSEDRPANPI